MLRIMARMTDQLQYTAAGEETKEVLLDLNFVPVWARTPPAAQPVRANDRPDGVHDRSPRGDGRDSRRGPPGRDRRPGPPRRDRDRDRRSDSRDAPAPRIEPLTPLPITIEFMPERHGMAPLARFLSRSGRAFALFDVAAMFFSKPEYFAVRLVVKAENGAPSGFRLFQCSVCKAVFIDRAQAVEHALAVHFDQWYIREEYEAEPPKGNFVCIARCARSGELLGPPNYHGFNERLLELHRRRFPNVPLDDYRTQIENIHDAELIARWLETMKKQVRFKARQGEEALARYSDVEQHFQDHHLKQALVEGVEFVIPGSVATTMADRRLQSMIRIAGQEEERFPLRMSIPIRLAFRRMGLNLFKTAGGATFVTAVSPNPIDPAQTAPLVREVLEYLAAHPGCTRDILLEGMRPGEAASKPEAQDLARQLRWLVARGHVIEFADGRMAVPNMAVGRVQLARKSNQESRRVARPVRETPVATPAINDENNEKRLP